MRRVISGAPRILPLIGAAAIIVATLATVLEGDPARTGIGERILRSVLFVLACFIGSYMPIDGQPPDPSMLSAWAMVLALVTSLGGVALAVLNVLARNMSLAFALARRRRVVVIGDTPDARSLALQLREDGRTVITVGSEESAMIRVVESGQIPRDARVRRAVNGAAATYILHESSVDGAVTAAQLRELERGGRIFQMFDWKKDRLVFREALRDGGFPKNETFSPIEITANHLARLIAHTVRMERRTLRVHLQGTHPVLEILRERLTFMSGALAFCGGVEPVSAAADADIVVIGVDQHEYVAAVDACTGPDRIVFVVAPERYFAAIGRGDLAAAGSYEWLAERDTLGRIEWAGRVVVVDQGRIGHDVEEISMGMRGRWTREFHNTHSDFGARDSPDRGSPNRWLDRPVHPRLVRMADAAVALMLRDLDRLGCDLVVRNGPHNALTPEEMEYCARRIHEQYLELTWTDQHGREHRCADSFVTPEGQLTPATPPPAWEEDTELGRERNRAMVREVYPALAAIFGYRITRRR